MTHSTAPSYPFALNDMQAASQFIRARAQNTPVSSSLAQLITREASTQTYFTIRYLVDRPLVVDAYRAYAYFRWVDDIVDQTEMARADRLAFLERQQSIITRCYQGEMPENLCPEERMVVDLIQGDQAENSGLRTYINQMMAVMVFDAGRKGQLITQPELVDYTRALATAVTEAMHYFIGHDAAAPHDDTRYLAVTGAHIVHMLRDAVEDAAAGYTNIPQEFLESHNLSPTDINHPACRTWVQSQVQLARHHFAIGRGYLARLESLRCRLAGYAYIARFEVVLDLIEKDEYRLRLAYPERKSKKAVLKMCLTALTETVLSLRSGRHTPLTSSVSPTKVYK